MYQLVPKVLKRAQTKTDTMNLNKPFFLLTFHMKTYKIFSESAYLFSTCDPFLTSSCLDLMKPHILGFIEGWEAVIMQICSFVGQNYFEKNWSDFFHFWRFCHQKTIELSPESIIREWEKIDKMIICTLSVLEAWFGHCRVRCPIPPEFHHMSHDNQLSLYFETDRCSHQSRISAQNSFFIDCQPRLNCQI